MVAGAHAHAIDESRFRERANRLGLWIFLFSEAFLFAAFLSARFVTSQTERPEHLNQGLALVITIVLLASSISAFLSEAAIAHGDRRLFLRFTNVTILLGLVFMAGVVLEWREALEFFPPGTLFGSAFFTLIGLHAFHVFTGLAALAVIRHLGRRGHFDSDSYWGVEGVVKYWHFVDVAWVVIYPTLYLF
jgi:cytochrome c oxidase subunit 3